MPLKAPQGKTTEPIPEGVHLAVCTGIWDVGTHFKKQFDKHVHEVVFSWHLIDENRIISKTYTLSLHEKSSLRKDIETWLGRSIAGQVDDFNVLNMLGLPCQLQVLHSTREGKTYGNVGGLMALPKGIKITYPPDLKTFSFCFEDNEEIPEGTPSRVVDAIKSSDEWRELHGDQQQDEETPWK